MTALGHLILSRDFKCHVNASNLQITISDISPELEANSPTICSSSVHLAGSSIRRLSEPKLQLLLTDFPLSMRRNSVI